MGSSDTTGPEPGACTCQSITWHPCASGCSKPPPPHTPEVPDRDPTLLYTHPCDAHPLQTVLLLSVPRSDADVAKNAEPHGAAGQRVVAGRAADRKPRRHAAAAAAAAGCRRCFSLPAGCHNVVDEGDHSPRSLQRTPAGVSCLPLEGCRASTQRRQHAIKLWLACSAAGQRGKTPGSKQARNSARLFGLAVCLNPTELATQTRTSPARHRARWCR